MRVAVVEVELMGEERVERVVVEQVELQQELQELPILGVEVEVVGLAVMVEVALL
jgi:hypothetical protein